ncbi:MAG TPA: NHL repeat-containing protein [Thermodesulfovibrionales bacterium]|nr:NHL repeat-containing protein [Thermodesulfovibrionales bacterium]
MTRVLIRIFFVISALSLPLESFGAEAVKLRHVATAYFDAKAGGLKLPEGVGCNEGPVVVVADTGNGRLLKYTLQDNSLKGGDEFRVAEVPYPVRLQINSAGEIFALDGKQRRIARLSAEGVFKGYIDPSGLPDAATLVPRSFRLDAAGNIYMLDIFSGRVLILGPKGEYQRHIGFPAKYGFFSDVAVDSKGTIFLIDSVDSLVYSAAKDAKEFTPLGQKLEGYVNFPSSLAVDGRGTIYLADQNGSGVVSLGPDGSFLGRALVFGWKDGLVRYPSQICANDKGEFFVADRENNRVQIFIVVR